MVFVNDRYYVPQKLTLISTWDGDEVSLTRLLWELREARQLPIATTANQLRAAVAPLGAVYGEGLYLTVEAPRAETVRAQLATAGVRVGLTEEGTLRIAPPLDLSAEDVALVIRAVAGVVAR